MSESGFAREAGRHPGAGNSPRPLNHARGRHDSLAQAIEQNECPLLAPREKKRWELQVHIQQNLPQDALGRNRMTL